MGCLRVHSVVAARSRGLPVGKPHTDEQAVARQTHALVVDFTCVVDGHDFFGVALWVIGAFSLATRPVSASIAHAHIGRPVLDFWIQRYAPLFAWCAATVCLASCRPSYQHATAQSNTGRQSA